MSNLRRNPDGRRPRFITRAEIAAYGDMGPRMAAKASVDAGRRKRARQRWGAQGRCLGCGAHDWAGRTLEGRRSKFCSAGCRDYVRATS